MNIEALINKIKHHPNYHRAGMILCHNGVVRESARDGRRVTGLKVKVDHENTTMDYWGSTIYINRNSFIHARTPGSFLC